MRLAALLLIGAAATLPVVGKAHRELGAHEHGRGTLNIAIEGNKVTMELEVPGADIVGFEHAPKTAREKAAVEKAKAQLAAPLTLFKLPAAADCRVTDAKVEMETGVEAGAAKGGTKGAKEKDDGHSEFHGQYALECAAPAAITGIEFAFFRSFSGAEKLDVNLITPKGQSKFEVTRKKPSISLAGKI